MTNDFSPSVEPLKCVKLSHPEDQKRTFILRSCEAYTDVYCMHAFIANEINQKDPAIFEGLNMSSIIPLDTITRHLLTLIPL